MNARTQKHTNVYTHARVYPPPTHTAGGTVLTERGSSNQQGEQEKNHPSSSHHTNPCCTAASRMTHLLSSSPKFRSIGTAAPMARAPSTPMSQPKRLQMQAEDSGKGGGEREWELQQRGETHDEEQKMQQGKPAMNRVGTRLVLRMWVLVKRQLE